MDSDFDFIPYKNLAKCRMFVVRLLIMMKTGGAAAMTAPKMK